MTSTASAPRTGRVLSLDLRPLLLLLSPVFAMTAVAQQQPADLPAVLGSTDSVLKTMSTVVYDFESINWNVDGTHTSGTGKIFLSRHSIDDGVGFKLRYESNGEVLAYDGRRMLWLDAEQKKVIRLDEAMTMASYLNGNDIGQVVEPIILARQPFARLADNATLESPVEIAGASCAAVRVRREENDDIKQPQSRWCFGLDDHFPRRYELSLLYQGMPYADTLTFSNVHIDEPLDDALFAIQTPEQYELETRKPYVEPVLLAHGSALPPFELAHTRGGTITPAALRGKVVVLDFWYISCAPCLESMPKLSDLQKRFSADSVVVLGVNVRDSLDRVVSLLKSRDIAYESLLRGNDLATEMGIAGYPTVFVIGRDGTIAGSVAGAAEDLETQLATIIEATLAKP